MGPGADIAEQDVRRRRLRLLDTCLHALENAHERDQSLVTVELATSLAAVTRIRAGTPIRDAMDQVMREQEACLRPSPDAKRKAVTGDASALTTDEARDLTTRIRAAAGQVCLLLLEAYERRAAKALGYPTWQRYAKEEFGLSRSRSYELLDQGRAILTLREAAGMSGIPDISAQAARDIKNRLDDVVEAVRIRARDAAPEGRAALVLEVVHEHRPRPAATAPDVRVLHAEPPQPDELARVRQAIAALASLPSPRDVVAEIPDGRLGEWTCVIGAQRWLAEVNALLDQRWSRLPAAASG